MLESGKIKDDSSIRTHHNESENKMGLFDKLTLQKFNEEINEVIEENKINHIHLFATPSNNEKLSVTLVPDKRYDDVYHGLHPSFNERMLRDFLSNLSSNSASVFWSNVRQLQTQSKPMNLIVFENDNKYFNFLSHINEKLELEISLLGKAILQMSSHFGYRLKCPIFVMYHEVIEFLTKMEMSDQIFWKSDGVKREIQLLGIWPIEMIAAITSQFDVEIKNDELFIKKRTSEPTLILDRLLRFDDNWEQHYELITSDVYYSGVLPCVRRIELEPKISTSSHIKSLLMHVIRTSFATVDTFDNAVIMKHPFFHSERSEKHLNLIREFDRSEDLLQEENLFSPLESTQNDGYEQESIVRLNRYLSQSMNTHTIAVLANVITSDGYLLAAKRGALNIDAGEYYCSVNGQSEFRDERVDFYQKSVYEDMPTMDYHSKYRVDLQNEVQRECIAELGIATFNANWDYYGVSYLCINNHIESDVDFENSKVIQYRRMHFNVMLSNSTSSTFREVLKSHQYATENFENDYLFGIKFRLFKHLGDFILKLAPDSIRWMLANRSKVSVILIIFFLLIGKQSLDSLTLKDILEIVLLCIPIILIVVEWCAKYKIHKKTMEKIFFISRLQKDGQFEITSIFNSIFKDKEKSNVQAILYMMYALHLLKLVDKD